MSGYRRLPATAECFICGSKDHVERHHIDWHHDNNDPINLMVLCRAHHVKLHQVGFMDRAELEAIRRVLGRSCLLVDAEDDAASDD